MVLAKLRGRWSGTNKLWFEDLSRPEVSDATVTVSPERIVYSWAYQGKPQSGTIDLSRTGEEWRASWLDSWHTHMPMRCVGANEGGKLILLGGYRMQDADWGWRIELALDLLGRFFMRMFNIDPEGRETLAVELDCLRAEN
jgi:hypothetical protein